MNFSDQQNILSSVTDIHEYPFPYGKTYNCLPIHIYNVLASTRPKLDHQDNNNRRFNVLARDILENDLVQPLWKEFAVYHTSQSFYRVILSKFGKYFKQFYPQHDFEKYSCGVRGSSKDADIYLDCQISVNSPVTSKSTVSVPHVDEPHELWASLFYMREPDDNAGGNLVLHKYRQIPVMTGKRCVSPHDIIDVETIRYEANSLACFMNSAISAHSVTPREVTNKCRLFCNVNLEFADSKPELFSLKRFPCI